MTMLTLALALLLLPVACFAYAYAGYPLLLRILAARRPAWRLPPAPADDAWPGVTLILPAYNEERRIAGLLDAVLALDYPADRLQRLVVSDASSDATDVIVATYAGRGIELLRMTSRHGKTAAENAAIAAARHDIIVNMDASVRVPPGALKSLVRAFGDPAVGVASARDVSVGAGEAPTGAEAGYVGYEMWVRGLETRLGGIVGASGCFFAIRRATHQPDFPTSLSRDFASVLMARERGFRGVSVEEATCFVPRSGSLGAEHRRKARTMARGLQTLAYKRHLMNPFRYGFFAFALASHKLARWLVYLTLPLAAVGLVLLALASPAGILLAMLVALGTALGAFGSHWPFTARVPRPLAFAGFAWSSAHAGVSAWLRVFRGEQAAAWEPTRRPA